MLEDVTYREYPIKIAQLEEIVKTRKEKGFTEITRSHILREATAFYLAHQHDDMKKEILEEIRTALSTPEGRAILQELCRT